MCENHDRFICFHRDSRFEIQTFIIATNWKYFDNFQLKWNNKVTAQNFLWLHLALSCVKITASCLTSLLGKRTLFWLWMFSITVKAKEREWKRKKFFFKFPVEAGMFQFSPQTVSFTSTSDQTTTVWHSRPLVSLQTVLCLALVVESWSFWFIN